jgi:hypothetical protein
MVEKKKHILLIATIVLLIVISVTGVLSLNFSKSYKITNQYGDIVQIYGSGIYAHDSFFKAPILIGSDLCILFVLVPLFICIYFQNIKKPNNKTKLKLMSLYGIAFYYAASISLGVTYNQYHLLYIALFTCSLFGIFSVMREIKIEELNYKVTKGIGVFLILAGIALIVAWMPDIIPTIISGKSLPLIEVYTTEITYVLDMGIIGPLCLVCLYLLKKKDKLGIVILASLLKACIIVGIMMISQTICQILSGYEVILSVLITKSSSFVLLGGFAFYFNRKLFNGLRA